MAIGSGLGFILAGLALLVALAGPESVAGFAAVDVAAALSFAAAALFVTARAVDAARGGRGAATNAVVLWTVSVVFLGAMFGHRAALIDASSLLGDGASLFRPDAEVGAGGEVTVTRRGGTFLVPARVNDREARFVFDTGASSVVLTSRTAEGIGLALDKLSFRIPVETANGLALAAPVTLEQVQVGSIMLRRVRALVVRPGLLHENLLGMTFLERLSSYEVRGDKLVLRAEKPPAAGPERRT